MGLNVAKGQMYDFIDYTWNTVKGACPHDCSYCYMKRWGTLKQARFDEKELKTDLGKGNFIFVGSSCDLFAESFPNQWRTLTLEHCEEYENKYLFQSKNPEIMVMELDCYNFDHVICTTIETNRWYPDVMGKTPRPEDRAYWMSAISHAPKYVTIEPIMDFDLEPLVELIKRCDPVQVNIGADSGRNNLPEPTQMQIIQLVDRLSEFTTVAKKRNIERLLPF